MTCQQCGGEESDPRHAQTVCDLTFLRDNARRDAKDPELQVLMGQEGLDWAVQYYERELQRELRRREPQHATYRNLWGLIAC